MNAATQHGGRGEGDARKLVGVSNGCDVAVNFQSLFLFRVPRKLYFEYLRHRNRVAFSTTRFQLLVIVCRHACLNYFSRLNFLRLTRPPLLRVEHVWLSSNYSTAPRRMNTNGIFYCPSLSSRFVDLSFQSYQLVSLLNCTLCFLYFTNVTRAGEFF